MIGAMSFMDDPKCDSSKQGLQLPLKVEFLKPTYREFMDNSFFCFQIRSASLSTMICPMGQLASIGLWHVNRPEVAQPPLERVITKVMRKSMKFISNHSQHAVEFNNPNKNSQRFLIFLVFIGSWRQHASGTVTVCISRARCCQDLRTVGALSCDLQIVNTTLTL